MITELQIKSKTDKELANVMKLAACTENIRIINAIWCRERNALSMLVERYNSKGTIYWIMNDYLIGLRNDSLEVVANYTEIAVGDDCPIVEEEFCDSIDGTIESTLRCYEECEYSFVYIVKNGVWQEV